MATTRSAAGVSTRRVRTRLRFLLPAGLILPCVTPAAAPGINIVVQFAAVQSDAYIDPDGIDRTLDLIPIMNEAAFHWFDLIQDAHTLTINYWWDDLGLDGGIAVHGNAVVVNGLEISADIRFGTLDYSIDEENPVAMPWWFDASPAVDEEFDMTQTLYRSLSNAEQLDYFSGAPPETFEAGYEGVAADTAPDSAKTRLDILSSALHEIGHGLGLTDQVSGAETADFDYDIDPAFVRGAVMAVETASPTDRGHLESPTALMTPVGGKGMRRRPSAADVLSLAAGSGWTDIDLPRQDFLGGSDWDDPFNWLGGSVPDAGDEAYIRPQAAPSIVHLSSSANIARLVVADGSFLSTNAFTLTVGGTTTVDGVGTQIFANTGGVLRSEVIELTNGGELDMTGGVADANDAMTVSIGSRITGNGTIEVAASFENSGLIRPDDGTLTLTTTGSAVWDLDGILAAGEIDCTEGDLLVMGTLAEPFNGTAVVGSDHSLAFDDGWTLGANGELNFFGAKTAALVAGASVVQGVVNVSGMGQFRDEQTFGVFANVSLPKASDALVLRGPTILDGAEFTGDGVLQHLNDVTVISDTTLDNAVYDWGNSTPGNVNQTTVVPNAAFTVNSSSTGTPDNEHRGTILLNNGELVVQTKTGWTLPSDGGAGDATPGVLILNNNNEDRTIPTVRGSDVTLGGVLQASGGLGVVESVLITLPTGEIEVLTAAELSLAGHVNYDGPLVHGAGTLIQNNHADVVSPTTIGTNIFDWDGNGGRPSNTSIAAGTALTIESSQIDVAAPATDGYGGHVTVADTSALIVITAGPWRLDGTMTLAGQPVSTPSVIVDGSELINHGTIEGNGRIQANVENHGTLSPGLSAGALRFDVGLTLAADSLVEIELGGLTPLAEYDRIIVNQFSSAHLAGGLEVSLIDDFVPKDGDEFTILTAGAVNGSFNDALVAGVNLPTGVTFSLLYNATDVMLLFDVDYPADFNMDGVVDGNDLTIWEASYGADPGGDADGDNDTDGADFLIWQQQLGSGLPAVAASGIVPEPHELGSLAIAAVALLGAQGFRPCSRQRGRVVAPS